MTGPVQGRYTVRCDTCQAAAYTSGDTPHPEPGLVLREFADTRCPIGGTGSGCPSTTGAQEAADEERPHRLHQLIQAAKARLPRSRSLVLPALTANTPIEVPITWSGPMPDATYQVSIGQEFAAPVLLGRIEAVVLAGSRTPLGCTLLVAASRDVADGQAGLHVTAIP